MKQEDARELLDLIRAKVSKEAVFILVISDEDNGRLVSNLGSTEVISHVLRAVVEEYDSGRSQVIPPAERREADGTGEALHLHETGGSGGH